MKKQNLNTTISYPVVLGEYSVNVVDGYMVFETLSKNWRLCFSEESEIFAIWEGLLANEDMRKVAEMQLFAYYANTELLYDSELLLNTLDAQEAYRERVGRLCEGLSADTDDEALEDVRRQHIVAKAVLEEAKREADGTV